MKALIGFRATVVEDATRALSSDDFEKARKELEEKGVRFAPSTAIRD